jgi:hypothetical protein
MLPAWGLYLAFLMAADRRRYAMSCLLAGALALVPFIIAAGLRYPLVQAVQSSGGLGQAANSDRIIPLILRYGFYLGAPMCLLAAAGPLVPGAPREGRMLLASLAFVPVVETFVLAALGRANVSIHHGFLATVGFAGLAGVAMDACRDRSRWLWRGVGGATAAYYALGLALYFSVMHGDRPRWKDAADLLQTTGNLEWTESRRAAVYSTGPHEMAYYLGAPADKLLTQTLVAPFTTPAALPHGRPAWIVVDAVTTSDDAWNWLRKHARSIATFPARTGPRDRTVAVFRIE